MSIRQKEDYFENLLKKFTKKILKALKIDYGLGSAIAITNAKIDGKQTNKNPLNMSKKDQKANIKIMEDLIKDVNLEMSKKINYAINKNITEKGSPKDLKKELKEIFNEDSPNYFNYKNRFENIATTESARILNTSANNTAQQLGAKKKYLMGVDDSRQGEDSKIALRKYGSPEQAIPIDKPFRFNYGGKEYVYMYPPNRPRDRELALYTFD